MISCLVNTRNCLVSNYGVNINYIYNKHGVVNVKKSSLRYFFGCLTYACCIPFSCIKSYFTPKYNIIYNMDDLYYTTDTEATKITPIIISAKAINTMHPSSPTIIQCEPKLEEDNIIIEIKDTLDKPIENMNVTNQNNELKIDINSPDNNIFIDITNEFKVFNNLIPLWIFIRVVKLDLTKYDKLEFIYLLNGKMNTKKIIINEMKDVQLYKLFI